MSDEKLDGVCDWCGVEINYPHMPCSECIPSQINALYYSGTAPDRCAKEIEKRDLV
jgi:hypothetical protein